MKRTILDEYGTSIPSDEVLHASLRFAVVRLADRITDSAETFTRAERRVAELVLAEPEAVAFGTVADVAKGSGSGAATVVRLCTKLGFDGFSDMQAWVRTEMTAQLRPASERIREPAPGDLMAAATRIETSNVVRSLEAVSGANVTEAAAALCRAGRVLVVSGAATFGVAFQFASELGLLRDNVTAVNGNPFDVSRALAFVDSSDVVVAIDLRRYERWVIDAVRQAAASGADVLALTDGRLSPLARLATWVVAVSAGGVGPFDSQVGTLAVLNVLLVAVSDNLRGSATDRLDALEQWWQESDLLLEE
jgi:DNA-binding MurR/RpiR family transcriptional regulator